MSKKISWMLRGRQEEKTGGTFHCRDVFLVLCHHAADEGTDNRLILAYLLDTHQAFS